VSRSGGIRKGHIPEYDRYVGGKNGRSDIVAKDAEQLDRPSPQVKG